MKTALFDSSGNKKSEIELPKIFNSKIRQDIALKCFEAEKMIQPYSHSPEAGKRHSASGTISHRRHEWKGHYGKGISRIPRKTMWRRGTQFYWIGAEISSARGGRRAHGPMLWRKLKKINKKESDIALNSAIAATANKELILSRYSSLEKINYVPAVIESLPDKSKEMFSSLKNIFGDAFNLVLKQKQVRSGKGKLRGRKYKSNAGLLLIAGKDEKAKFKGIDIKQIDKIKIADLYPLGRLTLYTKKALAEMEEKK